MSRYHASVHYNDWKGSAAADNADLRGLHALLSERRLISRNEVVVRFKANVWIHHTQALYFSVSADVSEQSAVENAALKVRKVDISELSPIQFFGLFKRFEIALEHKDFHAV
ncbi:hypothetical protein [Methylocystis heyeri]|uniref:Uncharacterized protein n=1 Tax=Methylocystis heyeri TaxID=391905 RepID=A0A6B8KM91_9HYPH|nr:hypothetical protein [Methylocystis heyeri]QGM48265.1 hypothetical protein H2LOC_020990 [Methylocystis heyeri]